MPSVRKAWVRGVKTDGTLDITMVESGAPGYPPARPFLGGARSGFHTAPAVGDQVLVLAEQDRRPDGSVSVTDSPAGLPALAAGESAIYHEDGRVAAWLQNGGNTLLYSDSTGYIIGTVPNATRGQRTLQIVAGGQVLFDINFAFTISGATSTQLGGHVLFDPHPVGGIGSYSGNYQATATFGAAAGNTPNPTRITTSGKGNYLDMKGTFAFTTGGTIPAAGQLVIFTFATAYGTTPTVALTPGDAATAALLLYRTISTTALTVCCAVAPAASTTYSFDYHIIQ